VKITLVTPTADQPLGIQFLEKYVARQTVQPDQWIIADDGVIPAVTTMGQTHLVRPRAYEGARSLHMNFRAMMDQITDHRDDHAIIVMEHDDWYAPNHIERCVNGLQKHALYGSSKLHYFNVEHRVWCVMQNKAPALHDTSFRASFIPEVYHAIDEAYRRDTKDLDRCIWLRQYRTLNCGFTADVKRSMVGIKGLPGRKGLGIGHFVEQNPRLWRHDPIMAKLSSWISHADAQGYADVYPDA